MNHFISDFKGTFYNHRNDFNYRYVCFAIKWHHKVIHQHLLSFLFLPYFFFLWSRWAARVGIPLLAPSSVHTMAWNNKLDVVGSTRAERRWQGNTHLHAGLRSVRPKWEAADSHFYQSAVGRRLRREKLLDVSRQTELTTRRVRRQLQSPTCHHFGVAAKPEEDKVLSKTSSISSARHSWEDRNSHVRHTTGAETAWNVATVPNALHSSFLKQTRWFFFFFSAASTLWPEMPIVGVT